MDNTSQDRVSSGQPTELDYEQLLEAEREQRLLAETLGEVFLTLTAQTSYEAVLDEILRQVRRLVSYSATNIMLLQNDILQVVRWQGYDTFRTDHLIANLEQPLDEFPIDASIIHSRKALVIPDVQQEPQWITTPTSPWIKSFMAVPICHQDRVLGILRLDSDTPYNFSPKDIQRLQPLANAAAIALENARLYEQAQQELAYRKQMEIELVQRNTELLTLLYAGATISTSLDTQIILETITREMTSLLDIKACLLSEWDEFNDKISLVASYGLEAVLRQVPKDQEATRLVDFVLARRVLSERHAQQIVLDQPWVDPADAEYMEIYRFKTLLVLPMEFQNRLVGLIQVMDNESERVFSYTEVALAQLLANQAAGALENAHLYRLAQQELGERIKAEEELSRVAARNQAILDALPDILLVLDRQGNVLDHQVRNPLSLHTREKESSKSSPVLPHNWTALILPHIDQLLATGQIQTFEYRQASAGPPQDFEVRLVMSGRYEILAIIRNISARKQAERDLQESETKFRTLTETTAAAIFIYQGDQNRYVNPSAETVTGYTASELLSMTFWDVVHPDFRELIKTRGKARQRHEQVLPRYELKILTKQGQEKWIDVTLGVIKFEGETGVLGTAFDISERKWAVEALRKSEANLKAIFDNSLQAFVLIDLDYKVQTLNKRATEGIKMLFGKEIGPGASIYDFIPEIERAEFEQCFARVTAGESIIQERKVGLDETERWVEYRYNPVFSDEGRVVGICFSTVDIDERKRAADMLIARETRLLAEMQSVLSITRALVTETNLHTLLDFIITQAKSLMKTDGVVVLLLSEDGQYLQLAPRDGSHFEAGSDFRLPLRGSLAELALSTHTVQLSQEVSDDYIAWLRRLLGPKEPHSLICAPLENQGQTLGVLLLWSKTRRRFTERDSYMVHLFADQAALALYNARLHIENRRLAVEQERERLARELHDSVTQSLYSIGLAAQTSLRLLKKQKKSKLQEPISYIHSLSRVALAEMRERVYNLYPAMLKDKDLVETIREYCEMLSAQYGLTIDIVAEEKLDFSLYQRENLYYIAREALWNVVKHAGKTKVVVKLFKEADQFVLVIRDEGPGFALLASHQAEMVGLRSMDERAQLLMGSFKIQSDPGAGTQVIVRIPIELSHTR